MAAHIALLRSVNVGGRNQIAMAALRSFATALGFANARTLLQSGNLIFESAGKTPQALEFLLESDAKTRLGLDLEFFVRSAKQVQAIIAHNPFEREAMEDPSHLLVMVMKQRVAAADVAKLQQAIKGSEIVRAWDCQAYITYPDGIGRSKLTIAMIEKYLGSRGTGRNWNTILKLAAAIE